MFQIMIYIVHIVQTDLSSCIIIHTCHCARVCVCLGKLMDLDLTMTQKCTLRCIAAPLAGRMEKSEETV